MAFQHRAAEFLDLAAELRRGGYGGHVCAGGHVATVMPEEVLRLGPAVDSALGHEAEDSVVRLLRALGERRAWPDVPALSWRDPEGSVRTNPPAPARHDLDALPLPARDTPLRTHLGLPFAPLSGSRGCYGSCRFCAISTFHRRRPGPRMRFRSPANIAAEMAALYHDHGARIFCFHDETLFLPKPAKTRARLDELAAHLRRLGVGHVAVVGKARPDAIDPALLRHLRDTLGLMRLYIGIENWSAPGLAHLGRGVTPEMAAASLSACVDSGVYGCYNLLLFEPDTTFEDVGENIRGMERFAGIPVNFCRAEAYTGTPLWTDLRAAARLRTAGFATDYTIADPGVQRLFEIVHEAFRDRNFAADGLANMNMSVGYERQLLAHFAPEPERELAELLREVDALQREIGSDTRARLGEALEFARSPAAADRRAVAAFTFDLATRINLAGANLQARLVGLRREMNRQARASATFRGTAALPGGR
jgi:hypothetical protein